MKVQVGDGEPHCVQLPGTEQEETAQYGIMESFFEKGL